MKKYGMRSSVSTSKKAAPTKAFMKNSGLLLYNIGKRVGSSSTEAKQNETQAELLRNMEEIQRLRKELAETKKENDFLKKLAAFYAKETK